MAYRTTFGLLALCAVMIACSRPGAEPPATPLRPPASTARSAMAPPAPAEGMPQPYVLEGTEVRTLHADGTDRDYQVFVSLPRDYADHPERRYPVLFVTDANYAFPLIRSIARRVGEHEGGTEAFILVGLSYAVGETPEYSRRRDYTPTPDGDPELTSDMPGRAVVHGGGEAYARFIKNQVFPLIAGHYRADMQRKIYAGHSYGGLLGADILIHDPGMFQYYILGSPSFQFAKDAEFARLHEAMATRRDMPANVLIVLGGYESLSPGSHDPRFNHSTDMVAGARRFVAELKAKHYPGLHIQMTTVEAEDHLTVFPAVITRGLLWALPGKAR
ncbi:alpha/beta hydrolase-fold protein [Luteibacter sp. ME-Dv--P-043b]|uniref:alpha/beta hydrolase n=1 Tax=Luteibacter sp. ME-Dv--P-043b TaxID=3040291 RepID=UPI002552A5F5|nr:alpha/beta hydrolase-fold protein [Luteibacter sp. ME-Dv--P-043b]